MTGAWIVHETNYAVPNVGVSGLLTASTWYYMELVQTGDTFVVTNSLFCGNLVTGALTEKLTDGAVKALLYRNRMDGASVGGQRTGTMMPSGGGCYFAIGRHYSIYGGKEALLPTSFGAKPDLATLPALPVANDLYDPSKGGTLDLAEDSDGDGFPGVSSAVSGLVAGTRNVVRRDWVSYESDAAHVVPRNATQLTVRSDFRVQQQILHIQCGSGGKCPLLESTSAASLDKPGQVTLSYVGKSWSEGGGNIVVVQPGSDPAKDFQTCQNIQTAMPHMP